MVQIGGYLTPEEHAEFKRYAAEFHLKESSLANLLIARELCQRRLDQLRHSYLTSAPLKIRSRVTAHQPEGHAKLALEALASSVGISPDQAASVIFRAELTERWLAKCVRAD